MRNKVVLFLALAAFASLGNSLSTLHAQGTAFTYQGRLIDAGAPANGTNYGMVFNLFDAPTNGIVLGSHSLASVTVSNGLFTVPLNFGNAFDGNPRWLEITVQKNGGSFTMLSPRQPLTPTPYAIMASTASNLLGALSVAQLSGTMNANQLPPTLVTNNAMGLNLSGTFNGNVSGNGGGLTNLSGTLPWQVVSGTNQQAQPNSGYLLANSALSTVTLPASPATGDIVRVSGPGAGGWKIAQNAGQSVLAANLAGNIGVTWTPRENSRFWNSLASSADGNQVFAIGLGTAIFISTDSGGTWTARDISRNWLGAASSADGTKLVAALSAAQIYTSTNSGLTWTPRDSGRAWRGVASSADGTKLVGVVFSGQIYTSINSGETWTARDTNRQWNSVASSADGTKLVATAGSDLIYTSTNSGVTWTGRENVRSWRSVASSADGVKLVAVGVSGSQIRTSTDSGVTWTARESNRTWTCVASSADGTRLVAAVNGGQIYTSTDSGVTWTPRESSRSWAAVACSADGAKLFAAVSEGQIYTSVPVGVPSTMIGSGGYLQGNQNSAIELQYVGNGQYLPISFVGLIQAF